MVDILVPPPILLRLGSRSIALGLVGGSSVVVGAEVGRKVVHSRLRGPAPARRGCEVASGLGMSNMGSGSGCLGCCGWFHRTKGCRGTTWCVMSRRIGG